MSSESDPSVGLSTIVADDNFLGRDAAVLAAMAVVDDGDAAWPPSDPSDDVDDTLNDDHEEKNESLSALRSSRRCCFLSILDDFDDAALSAIASSRSRSMFMSDRSFRCRAMAADDRACTKVCTVAQHVNSPITTGGARRRRWIATSAIASYE